MLADLLPRYLDPKAFRVVQGSIPETTRLLKERFDTVFFTGSAAVRRIVRTAHQVPEPVVLELGGQSPCIVDKSADLKLAALRIVFAKFANAGQSCVAPNHIFVHRDVADEFTRILKQTMKFYGPDFRDQPRLRPHRQPQACRPAARPDVRGKPSPDAVLDADDLYIAPTILADVDSHSPVMQEEIFGPCCR